MADPIQEPTSEPAAGAPSGAVSSEAKCCANVASFEGSPAASKVYGLDPKTCLPETESGTYWASGSAPGLAPSDNRTRDGARWASVGVGMETELEITFDDESAAGCIANSTFHMEPGHIASIVTSTVSSRKAQFRIKGQVEGEATLVVRCNGEDKGWFHVACLTPMTRQIETGLILTKRTKVVAYDVAGMQAYFNKLFRQALISFEIIDLGVLDLRNHPGSSSLDAAEADFYFSYQDTGYSNVFFAGDPYVPNGLGHFGAKVLPIIDALIGPKRAEDRLLRYIPGEPYSTKNNGAVPEVGAGPGVVFQEYPDEDWSHNVLCHEYGHICGLEHPDEASTNQLPKHLLESRDKPIPAYTGTNTEMASPKGAAHPRIMALDPLNLMGYWPEIGDQLPIRKDQWAILRQHRS